jgi:hypothetical protein
MRKTILSALAVVAALTLVAAPASASERHGHFGLAALAVGVIGAVVGAEVASHGRHNADCRTKTRDYYDDEGDFRGEQKVTFCRD